MQEKRKVGHKKLAATPSYISPMQLTLVGFETPFERRLLKTNRWVQLAQLIPWDRIVPLYDKCFSSSEGRPPINGRVVIGAIIIKHIESLTDRATLQHISENVYMQYFLGYSSFTDEPPFTAPLFVSLRKRMSLELTNKISELVALSAIAQEGSEKEEDPPYKSNAGEDKTTSKIIGNKPSIDAETPTEGEIAPNGKLLMDATVAPQDITFPTDIKLLDSARRKSEELIDHLYNPAMHGPVKPRTYRQVAHKVFLNIQKKKIRSVKQLHKAIGQQLRFLRRNLKHIETLLAAYQYWPLKQRQYKYLLVLQTVYEQQHEMHKSRTHRVADRIVNIHQPHVRPMVRGKDRQNVEFGSKIQMSLVDGFAFIDKLDWNAFNEGASLKDSVNHYRQRFGFYPAEVLADKIYCNRENRKWLKERGIRLAAKPLGRPSAQAVDNHVRPGQRNPIEGKFGQAKTAYGLNLIRARLKETSESWIACIALVLNLVRLAGKAPYSLIQSIEMIIQSLVNKLCLKKSKFMLALS
jgi:transposase, IS5 family